MGHGTLVSGTQRMVTGGLTLVGGVQRKITKGLTLVDGVQRDIGFAKMFTVTMTGTWDSIACYISIDGVTYYAAQTIEVPEGTEMYCCVFNLTSTGADAISVNGDGVATQFLECVEDAWYEYTHIVTSDLIANGFDYRSAFSITITTS